ncbi:MAG TPA: GSCFA domain-containing protein [Saprospiraceae bacterium]|nr:GSCFA domain-containing protein [Saprospiraceae bacterium]HMP25554.1 GSCFA domain-containing protein [Saprospiraceae bacterium]
MSYASFRTELPPLQGECRISHHDRLLSIGSCFTQHIGGRLQNLKFRNLINPFGIVYNPLSIGNMLHYLLSDQVFTNKDLLQHNGQWHSWLHHSSFSGTEPAVTLAGMNQALDEARAYLPEVNRLLLTLGTARVFVLRATGEVVSNCHKMPAVAFTSQRLHIRDIAEGLEPALREWKRRNPELEVILTISPVRHLREGMIENQRSKAALLIAIQHLCEDLPYAHYFPAYEIMMDDLRDYRFYEADMIHPNAVAVDYIWQRFGAAFFTEATRHLLTEIEAVLQAARHRPFQPESQAHQAFLRKQVEKIARIEAAHPELDFAAERAQFEAGLVAPER